MPEVALYFEARDPQTETLNITELSDRLTTVGGVTRAKVEIPKERTPVDVSQVIAFLQLSTEILGSGALALLALRDLIDACGEVAKSIGFKRPLIQYESQKLDISSVTSEQAAEILGLGDT